MSGETPIDKLFSLAALIVICVALLAALSHKSLAPVIKTIGGQFNSSLKIMSNA